MLKNNLLELRKYLQSLLDKEVTLFTDNFEFKGKIVEVTETFAVLRKDKDLYETSSVRHVVIDKIVAISER
jgi:hypothetical protein